MTEDKQQENMTDHDLLVRIDVRVAQMERWATNHDTHHFRYNLLAWSVAISAIISLIVFIVTK